MAALAVLPPFVAVPTVAGILAYIDGLNRLTPDVHIINAFVRHAIGGIVDEYRDRLNPFYKLEEYAKSKSHANKPFIIFEKKSWTYRQSYEQALRYGHWIKQRFGVKKNEIVAMDFVNSDVFVWIWMGLWSIGAKPAFVNYNLGETPLLHTIKSSTSRIVLVDPQVQDKFGDSVMSELSSPSFREAGGSVEVCFVDAGVLADIAATEAKRYPDSERSGQKLRDMGNLIYTSGTTGLPKPAAVSWFKLSPAGRYIANFIPIKDKDVMYTSMPLYHSSAALFCFCAVLQAGGTLSLGAKFSRTHFWEEVRETNATIIQYVGETCRYLLSAPPSPLDKKHKVKVAFGNGLRPDIWPVFKERFGIETVAEFYAATEAPAGLWNRSSNAFSEGAVGNFGTIVGLSFWRNTGIIQLDFEENVPIRDPKTGLCKPVATNEPGELLYKLNAKDVDAGFQGYFGNKKATSSKVYRDVYSKGDAWFSSGDVMRKDKEGRFFFCDRIGDTFRWKSENVSTAEVSEVLGKSPFISEANVYGVDLPNHDGRAGCAAVVLHSADESAPATPSPDSIQNISTLPSSAEKPLVIPSGLLPDCATRAYKELPRYAVPVFIRVLSPATAAANTTGNNKQQKHVLRKQGVDPALVGEMGDQLFWIPPGQKKYEPFGAKEWAAVKAGKVKL